MSFVILANKGLAEALERLQKILEEMDVNKENNELKEMIQKEWKLISVVIDRLCFVTFSIILVCSSIFIFLSSPNL